MEEKRANNDRRNENRRKDDKETNIDYYFITDCKSKIVPGYKMIYTDLMDTRITHLQN